MLLVKLFFKKYNHFEKHLKVSLILNNYPMAQPIHTYIHTQEMYSYNKSCKHIFTTTLTTKIGSNPNTYQLMTEQRDNQA